jgi:hypothetical protein
MRNSSLKEQYSHLGKIKSKKSTINTIKARFGLAMHVYYGKVTKPKNKGKQPR